MRCKQCKQAESPIYELTKKLNEVESILVLSSCAGYRYEGHQNVPDRPYILFSVYSWRQLENLWQKVFSKLSVPTWLIYNGARQFVFEIDLPQNWPRRDEVIEALWSAIADRMKEFK